MIIHNPGFPVILIIIIRPQETDKRETFIKMISKIPNARKNILNASSKTSTYFKIWLLIIIV